MDNEEQPKIMSVDSLIALCYILDDYKKFDKNIQNILTERNYIKVSNDLSEISNNPRKLGGKTARELYRENKNIIDTINRHSNISSFLYYNDKWHKNVYSRKNIKYELDCFYDYINNNKNKLLQIRSVLGRIKKLGIGSIEFSENLDFTNNTYEVNTKFTDNKKIYYLDNISVIPNYDRSIVKYKTVDSPYEISVKPNNIKGFLNTDLSKYNSNIKLNSLVFDKDKLPKELNKSIVFDRLIYLKRRVSDACNSLINYVDLSIDINTLKNDFDEVVDDLLHTNDIKNKENIHKTIIQIGEGIKILEAATSNYKEQIASKNNISNKEIDNEKETEKILRKRIIRGVFNKSNNSNK